jgi:hypothetical protein
VATTETSEQALAAVKRKGGQIELLRPLEVLEPLIREQIAEGNHSIKRSLEFYLEAGQLLREAKEQVPRRDWSTYVKAKFKIGPNAASRWMHAASQRYGDQQVVEMMVDSGLQRAADFQPIEFKTLSEITQPKRHRGHRPAWHQPVQHEVAKLKYDQLIRQMGDKAKENRLLFDLALQMVDIGYKVLATKLHPDKGGSAQAMQRLNLVRKSLKQCLEETWKKPRIR